MEFTWAGDALRFRRELSSLLDELVPADRGRFRASVPYDAGDSRRVCTSLAERGWLVPHWPTAWGGRGHSPWFQLALAEEMWRRGEPRAPQYLNTNFIGPAIMRFGTDEQRSRYLPPIAAGTALWCQAFSEPDAGSDLSRIRTTATLDGGSVVVAGRKTWISYADIAEHCFLLARHVDPTAAAGAARARTVLLVPMTTPGISVREIGSIVGDHTFHELLFDDVRLPSDCVLGDPARGWDVVKSALADERGGAPEYMQAEAALSRAVDRPEGVPDLAAAAVGEAWVRTHGARLLSYRAVDERVRGDDATTAAYRARAYGRVARQAVADALTVLDDGVETLHQEAEVESLNAILAGVAGGAYEILLDLLASAPRDLR